LDRTSTLLPDIRSPDAILIVDAHPARPRVLRRQLEQVTSVVLRRCAE